MISNSARSLGAVLTLTVAIGFVASLPGCAGIGPIAPVGESRGRGKIVLSGGRLILEGERGRGVGTLMRNQAGGLVMNIDATLSDNSTLSARLWRKS